MQRRPPTVVITRPLAQAQPLAQRLAQRGSDVAVFPLLEILPLPDLTPLRAALDTLDTYVLVAFVSPNAIDAAFALLHEWPRNVAIAVIGEGSRAALARHGITDRNARIISPLDPQRTDSQTLLAALASTLGFDALRGARVLIVRGETGRELLADVLRAQGAQVDQVAAYRRAAPQAGPDRLAQLRALLDGDCDWIITSSEAMHILLDMVRAAAGEHGVVKMQQQQLVVPHVRIAETAHALGFAQVLQTGSGDEALFAALQALQSRP